MVWANYSHQRVEAGVYKVRLCQILVPLHRRACFQNPRRHSPYWRCGYYLYHWEHFPYYNNVRAPPVEKLYQCKFASLQVSLFVLFFLLLFLVLPRRCLPCLLCKIESLNHRYRSIILYKDTQILSNKHQNN